RDFVTTVPLPRSHARKIGGIVGAATTRPSGDLRIHAQRTRALDRSIGTAACGNDRFRCDTLFNPGFEWRQGVERVGTRSAVAMPHARSHEQPKEFLSVRRT